MVLPTIDPQRGRAGIGFEVAGIGKAGISIGADSIGGKLGLGPVSVGVGTGSASGFESLEWDFGVAKQKTNQTGCTITRESWIVGVGVTESETWTDPRCELPPTPTPTPTPTPVQISPNLPSDLLPNNPSPPKFAVGCKVWQKTIIRYGSNTGSGSNTTFEIPIPDGIDWQNYDETVSSDNYFTYSEPPYHDFLAPNYFYRLYLNPGVGNSGFSDYFGMWLQETQALWDGLQVMIITSPVYSYRPNRFGKIIQIHNVKEFWKKSDGGWQLSIETNYSIDSLCVPESLKIVIPPPNPPPTKMDKACCAMLSEVHQVLAAREMLRGKCTFPWRLRMPGGQGEEVIKDYANFLRALAQEIDHLGIHPPKLYIQDNNNAVEGDQTVDIQYPSATSAFEAMMKQVWDDNADGDTRTNFLYRLAWMGIQNSEMTLKLSAKVHALCEGLGIETEVDTAKFPLPFNNAAGVKEKSTRGQGFGKKGKEIDKSVDANTELAVEKLLPEFLKCRDNEVLIERYSGDKDINDKLSLILLHLEKLNSK